MKKLLTILTIAGFMLAVFGFSLYFSQTGNVMAGANLAGEAFDVIGSKSGTTTTGVSFNNLGVASTTYPTLIGANTDTVTYTFYATVASATPIVYLSFFSSNDLSCDTASTTSSINAVTKGEINWFDAGNHLANLAGNLAQGGATSTLSWTPTTVRGIEVTLENLNSRCLAVQAHASGTAMWSQLNLKGKI